MVHKFFALVLFLVSFFYSVSDTPLLPVANADVPSGSGWGCLGGGGGGHDTDGAPSSDCAGGSASAGSAGACE